MAIVEAASVFVAVPKNPVLGYANLGLDDLETAVVIGAARSVVDAFEETAVMPVQMMQLFSPSGSNVNMW